MFTIEKGIDVPARPKNPAIETLKQIRVGESFVVPNPAHVTVQTARVWANNNGIKIATRKCDAGIRVWRLE